MTAVQFTYNKLVSLNLFIDPNIFLWNTGEGNTAQCVQYKSSQTPHYLQEFNRHHKFRVSSFLG